MCLKKDPREKGLKKETTVADARKKDKIVC